MTAPQPATSLGAGERLLLIGGLATFGASFVPWYHPRGRFVAGDRSNGWQEPDAVLSQAATLLAMALVVVVALAASGSMNRFRLGTWSWGTILTGASAASLGLIVLKLSLNLDHTTVGIYLALAAAATMLYGAYLTRTDEPHSVRVAGRSPGGVPDGDPRAQWPETTYLLTAYLQPAADLEAAAAAYGVAFTSDPSRLSRLRAELDALVVPERSVGERAALLAAAAPRWAAVDATGVLARLRVALAQAEPSSG